MVIADTAARLDSKIDKSAGPDSCWPWTGSLTSSGYGQFKIDGVGRPAHHLVYEAAGGFIPPGHHLDHVCHDPDKCVGGARCEHRRCVNPAHLEPVMPGENNRRSGSPSGRNGRKTECLHGHPFTPENTITDRHGHRRCRLCRKAEGKKRTTG